ncbi:MAG: hypothetical protein EOO56_17815 [Hymenobacter sp.]|nr:MAG: hypothetical protein EOO56_17815 [Hymenobacter sp.]
MVAPRAPKTGSAPAGQAGAFLLIMQEVTFTAGELIFAKGTLGTSLFIVCAGAGGIFDGPTSW